MDTLNVILVESVDFFSSIEFFAILIAALSLLVSIYAIYLQYRRGRIYVSPIRSFGIDNLHGGDNLERVGFLCILPIVFYNSGNKHKSITDIRLAVENKNKKHSYFRPNHFVSNLGSNPHGDHIVPEVVDWIHQFIVPPKDSKICYIEFLLHEDDVDKIIDLPKLIIHIQLKINEKIKYRTYQKFEKSIDEDFLHSLATGYVVYEADQA